jgi:hypothetical protein
MGDFEDFQAQQDLGILEEATKIENDPKRLSAIQTMAKKTLKRAEDVAKNNPGADEEAMKRDGFVTRTPKDVGL